MIKNKYIAACVALFAVFTAVARPLTPDEALARLDEERPASDAASVRAPRKASGLQLAMTQKTLAGDPAVYVFNNTDNKGYLVVSADDTARPLLGYSDSGSFPE